MNQIIKPQRQFLGKLINPLIYDKNGNPTAQSKAERNFNQKMLKAYLKGHEYFGKPTRNELGIIVKPFKVLQRYN